MLSEQYPFPDLITPTINDGGVNKFHSSLTSLDFYLLDDIDSFLPSVQIKKSTNGSIDDSNPNNGQHQDEFLLDFDFDNFAENSEFIHSMWNDINIEEWISQSSFPSPTTDVTESEVSKMEDGASPYSDENADMIVPPSPSLSSIDSSSPRSATKKTKLSIAERKLRKKSQNKTAAEKYRIKKKSERQDLLDRHSLLKTQNSALRSELEDLAYRTEQLKQLILKYIPETLPKSF